MTDSPPPVAIPPAVLEDSPCRDVKGILSQRDHRLNIYIGVAAMTLGFSMFIAIQAPMRQETIIVNQLKIITTLEHLEAEIQSLSRELERREDHGRRE
jgi:hypothetical protein